jgi:hypothetical protein
LISLRSYFDRLWDKGNKKRRFFFACREVPGLRIIVFVFLVIDLFDYILY